MTTAVQRIVEQVRALSDEERDELLSCLADFEVDNIDDWEKEIESDSQPGGRLEAVLRRVRKDIAEGRTQSLDEVLHHS